MAQRVHPLSLRLGYNFLWASEWYSNTNYAALFFEDNLIKQYFKNIFEKRGFLFKRALIKRSSSKTFIFLEIYGNPYFKYTVPKEYRKFNKFHRILQIEKIRNFLKTLSKNSVHISIQNLFLLNRIHRKFFKRLRGQFFRYKKYRFTLTILNIFNIVLRTKASSFFSRILAYELEFIERKKRNKTIWRFVSFIGKIVSSIKYQNKNIHGMRIQIKGRFRGIKRPKKVRFREGTVPFNTIRALIDYSYSPAITINGSFGIKCWICYKENL